MSIYHIYTKTITFNKGKKMEKVRLATYFDILPAIQDDKMNFEILDINNNNSIPFLGRSASNNGIVDYVKKDAKLINEGGVITIALDGSTGSTFYQHHPFSSGQNIWLLKANEDYFEEFNQFVALYCITSIKKAVVNYVGSYNLSLTKTRLTNNIEIKLPLKSDGKVDVTLIKKEMNKLRNINILKNLPNDRYFEECKP
jgi:hypothetical protein